MGRVEGERFVQTATIAAGATGLSDEVNVGGFKTMAIYMPAVWTTAVITFLASDKKGGTYQSLYDDVGAEVSITAAASEVVSCASIAVKLAPLEWIKLRSGTAATPVNQTAGATLKLLLKG